jgi:hypothetical protein
MPPHDPGTSQVTAAGLDQGSSVAAFHMHNYVHLLLAVSFLAAAVPFADELRDSLPAWLTALHVDNHSTCICRFLFGSRPFACLGGQSPLWRIVGHLPTEAGPGR